VIRIDPISKLQHLMQTLAFAMVIATLQVAFEPDKPYGVPTVYSLLIATMTWAAIDLGRHLLPSARETGWPTGLPGVALVALGIAGGWWVGNRLADALCLALGLYHGAPMDPIKDLRNSVLITVTAGIAGTYWFYSRNQSAYLERKMGEARGHADEARLKLLETQLEPHMLFNTLANLRVLIGIDPPRAQHMLDHMIAYLRATLDASRATTHPLQREFDRLRDYLELMAIRMGERLSFTLELPPELAQVRVPTLLLQPLVENSIQHGLEPKVQGGSIVVRAAREGALLVLTVDDTGVGDARAPAGGNGFGLAQIRERLQALHGERAHLDFRADAGGAHARITLPVA
jgi:hypothetical protein